MILRDNHLYDVDKGINLEIEDPEDYFWRFWEKDLLMAFLMYDTLPSSIGRLIISSNIIELSTTATDAAGIRVAWPLANPNTFQTIQQFIARKNRIQHVDGNAGSANTLGIDLASIKQAIVEENVISIGTDPTNPDPTKAIKRTGTVSAIKTFNNQSSAGVFLACWNGSSHDGDPITDMQDSLLGI